MKAAFLTSHGGPEKFQYGDMPDPVANAIGAMLGHINELDDRVIELCKLLHRLDARMPELELKKLELPDFCAEGPVTERDDNDDEAVATPSVKKGSG